MKTLIVSAVCTLLAFTTFAQEPAPGTKHQAPGTRSGTYVNPYKNMTPEQKEGLRQLRLKQHGGFLDVAGKGYLAILNAQTQFGEADVTNAVTKLCRVVMGLEIKFLPASFSVATAKQEREKSGAGACVFLVDDPALPMSLVAIEEGWGMVNVAPLKADNPAPAKLSLRFHKQLVRITSIVFSGCKSQYRTSPLQSVTSVAQLDKTVGENYGMDTIMAIGNHLPEIGVVCAKKITYREACQRGIAPQPTNEYQKAIWDQTHELPSEPLTIKK